MSLPAYLAPTASTRSKYQPKRAPTSSDHESSSSLVRRTSTSIKQLVNAATRTHHNHHGPEQTQSHSKRQPISSSTTPPVTTAKTTTTTQGRSSLESATPTSRQQPSSSSTPTTTTDSHPPHPPSSFRLKSAPNQPPQRTPSTTRTAKKTNVFGLSNTTDAARRMLSEPPLVVTCVPGRPITKYTKLAQKPAYTTSFVPIQPSVALLSSFTESTTSLASTLTLPSSSSRPNTPYSPSSSKSAPKTPDPPVPPLPSTATPKSPTISADPHASSSTSPIPSPAPISAPTPAPPTRSTSLFKPTASSLSKANAPHRLSRQGIPTTTTTTTATTATPAATKPAPQRAALPWLPPIDTTLHRPRPSIESPQGPSAGVAKRISVDRSRPSLDRFRPSPTTDAPAAAGTTTAHRQRPSVERASPTVAAGHGTRPSLGGRPSLDQQQQPHPQPQQKYHYHKRGKTSISSPFSSSGTFRSSPGPYSTTVSVNNSSGSSNGGSSPSASEASKSPPQSPRSKIQAFKSLFTRKRSDSASVVSATTNATATTTTTGVSRPARHERGQSSLASLGSPASAGIINNTGANRRTPSPGASTVLNLGGMHTGVALNKPKPLRGEGKKLEKLERKSEERERGRTASPGAAKELNRHIAGGSGMGADRVVNMDPDVDVDCGPPALTSLRKVHENIPVHGCSILEAPYPYSYEEFILQAEQHTHDLLTTVMGTRVPLFVNPEHLSRAREVLDLGCGRGVWMTEAAKEWKNARFVGIDLIDVFPSPEHLHKRCGLTEGQAARVQFKQGNFLKGLPFENDRFDYVRMAFLEHAISEVKWPTVLADVVRVLRPGGTLEIITEELIFPSHADWDVYAVQKHLEDDFIRLLKRRRLLGAMEKMGELLFDAGFKMVERHTPLVVCKAPTIDARKRSGSYGRRMTPLSSPLDGSSSPLWSSTGSGVAPTSPTPHTGYMTARSCNMPALIVEPEVFIPVSDDVLFKYASHASMMLNAARHATFAQAYDDDDEERWREYRARVFEYERLMRLRLGIREKQFDFDEDDDDYDEARKVRPHSPLAAGHDAARWRWRGDPAADAEADRPLKIRSFRAWSSTKPLGPVVIPWLGAGLAA